MMYDAFATRITLLIIYRIMISTSLKMSYQLIEEQQPPVILGNLLEDLNINDRLNPLNLRTNISIRFFPIQQPGVKFFQIDNFILKATKRIDREEICKRSTILNESKHICKCFATDDDCVISFTVLQTPYEITMVLHEIELKIIDINDNPPTFIPDIFSIHLSEAVNKGVLLTIPKAHDTDYIVNDAIRYMLSPVSQTFSIVIQNNSLYVKLQESLDRETIYKYELKVLAIDKSDGLSNTGILKLLIYVEDINDCFPEFLDKETKNISLPENSPPGQIIYVVQASDNDKGNNSIIHFSLSETEYEEAVTYFSLHHLNGELSIKKELDREAINRFVLIILAKDLGSPSKTSSMTINIIITDINDNPPYIKLDPVLFISENRPSQTVVTTFDVEDSDEGENALVKCELFSSEINAPFTLNFILKRFSLYVYKIKTTITFDRERRSFYNIIIHCRDSGSNVLSTDSKVLVLIEDDNDFHPIFTNAQNFSVINLMENTLFSDPIFKFQAIDLDIKENGKLEFSIIDNNYPQRLILNSSTGYLYANGFFDYEIMKCYEIQVKVQDCGQRPLSSFIHFQIKIINENDNPPEIINLRDNRIYIPENISLNSVIFHLKIIDRDDENDSQSADIFLMNNENYFVILGFKLMTIKNFNRELRDNYRISIVTRDKSKHDLSNIYFIDVIIEDINDCAPEFVFPSKDSAPFEISKDVTTGFTIAQISARDADSGFNAEITYELHNYKNCFSIELTSGYLTIGEHFKDIEAQQIILNISASDQGNPRLTSFTMMYVNISKNPLLKSISIKFDIFLQKSSVIMTFILCISIILLMSVGILCIVRRFIQMNPRRQRFHVSRSSNSSV